MESELNVLLNGIKKKTGIDIDVYAETKKFFYSTRGLDETVVPTHIEFDDVFADTVTDRTYFKLKFRNTRLIGSIKGATKTEYNYATLIMNLIESETDEEKRLDKEDYIKSLLNGDLNRTQIQKYVVRYGVTDLPCFALLVNTDKVSAENVAVFLENYDSGSNDITVIMNSSSVAYVRFVTAGDEYSSSGSFANMLWEALFEEFGVKVDVGVGGTVKKLTEAMQSYAQAQSAVKMSGIYFKGEGVHEYKDFLLVKVLEEVPKYKISEYLDMLVAENARGIFSDSDMVMTAETFLRHDLNVTDTADALYLHRNTLMYRLDKIEKATGLNIRKFSDAVTFHLIVVMLSQIK